MSNTISLTQAIDILNGGSAFDIEYVTADRGRGTGGELKSFRNVLKSGAIPASKKKPVAAIVKKKVSPQHEQHQTVNIYVPQEKNRQKRIKKAHLLLITKLNGKEVL